MYKKHNTTTESTDTLSLARLVLSQEASGLKALEKSLGTPFIKSVEILSSITGHIILTGMGKSGIIARKIASTLSSTGAPAIFIHPGEASHGDLGLITKNDAVVALSNSGNTKELHDLLEYTRRLSIPLIALTRQAGSILTEIATEEIILPNTPEACPNGLAPTTSTTMMMALGDALAVCLLKKKQFSAENFQKLHPGGNLGRDLLRVCDFMHALPSVPVVLETATLKEIIEEISEKNFGCTGVVNKNKEILGIITDGDLRRKMLTDEIQPSTNAKELMTTEPKVIGSNALLAEAVGTMNNLSITSLFVTKNNKPIGLLHIHDCLRAGFR